MTTILVNSSGCIPSINDKRPDHEIVLSIFSEMTLCEAMVIKVSCHTED